MNRRLALALLTLSCLAGLGGCAGDGKSSDASPPSADSTSGTGSGVVLNSDESTFNEEDDYRDAPSSDDTGELEDRVDELEQQQAEAEQERQRVERDAEWEEQRERSRCRNENIGEDAYYDC